MPKGKAPGPDGFTKEFFIEACEIVGEDTIKAVREFFLSGNLLKRFNHTAITLLPKVIGADQLHQFRPVFCCTTVYKIIATILKNRLKLIIPSAVQ